MRECSGFFEAAFDAELEPLESAAPEVAAPEVAAPEVAAPAGACVPLAAPSPWPVGELEPPGAVVVGVFD